MEFLFYLLVVILLVAFVSMRSRIDRLERLVQRLLESHQPSRDVVHPNKPIVPVPVTSSQEGGQTDTQRTDQSKFPQERGMAWIEAFVAWIKEDWLLKLGGLLLLIGFGWLVSYAFINNWIGPMGRIALGLVAGALFLVFGFWRIQKFVHQGSVFLVLGSTIILITIFAAREIYGFFTPLIGLGVMALSVAFVAYASVRYRIASLSFASLVLAGVAPLLTNSPGPDFVGLFWYLLVVVLATLWIVLITGKRELVLAALVLVVLYQFPHLIGITSADTSVLLLFAYGFAGIFFVVSTLGIIVTRSIRSSADTIVATGNGMLLLAWILRAAPSHWQSLIIVSWVLVFLVGAFLVFRSTNERMPFYLYSGVGVAMLVAATAVELRGAALTIAYTIESGLIVVATYAFTKDIRAARRSSLMIAGPLVMSLSSMASPLWNRGVFHKDFFVILILGCVLFGLGAFFRSRSHIVEQNDESKGLAVGMIVGGSVLLYVLIWLSLNAALENHDYAVMIALIVYTLVGLVAYFMGNASGQRVLKLYGASLLGFVVLRLLLVDVWGMALAGRIVTFFIVGALLMSTAFLGRKHRLEQQS